MPQDGPKRVSIFDGIEPQSIFDMEDFLSKVPDEHYYFRGHSSIDYRLQSSLERFCERWDVPEEKRGKAEQLLVRDFRRKLHRYDSDLPDPLDDLEWLAVMRHYGTPTRLLDFTYSKYVAAFFAVRGALDTPGADNPCEVWGIRIEWLIQSAERRLNSWREGERLGKLLAGTFNVQGDGPRYREILFHSSPPAMVLPCTSFRLNERLAIQRGVFLCPLDVRKTFDHNLTEMEGWQTNKNVVRYRIPGKLVRGFIRHLHSMNVTDATLYPGLDGFARSLALYQVHVDRLVHGGFLSEFREGQVPW